MEKLDPESVVGNYLMARYWYERKEYETARGYAEMGVDYLSVGALTHSAPALDLSLEIEEVG